MLLGLVAFVAHAQDPPEPVSEPADCPWDRRIGTTDPECQRNGASQAFLGFTSAAVAGAGTWWFVIGGDSVSSGDPAGQAIGIGLLGFGGALTGAIVDHLSPGAGAVEDRPARPTLRLSMGLGGATALDEQRPATFGIALDPTFQLSDTVQIQPHVGVQPGLFEAVDVDPRPQATVPIDGQDTTFPVGRRLRRSRFTVGAETTFRIRRARTNGPPRFSFRWRPTLEVRGRQGAELRTRHLALLPATVGFRWAVTPRQRFTAFIGPRLDWVGSGPEGDVRLGGPLWGPLYGEATYQIDVPLGQVGRSRATSRLNLGYIHSNLDGQAFDLGAIIGFFGPVHASVDLRLRREDAPVAWQFTAGSTIARGGGPFLEVGAVLGRAR